MKTSVALNKGQVAVVLFIAKYRFVTVSHVQRNFNYKSRTSVGNKLKRLVDAGYVGMRYDATKKHIGVPAVYFLTPQGMRAVRTYLPYITDAIIRYSYADKDASASLMQESADLFELSRALTHTYPNMKALTARQLDDITYFPRPLPNLYLAHTQGEQTQRFFLYLFRDTKRYDIAINSAITKLIAYRETDMYSESGNEFPVILFVCATATVERHAQRVMRSKLNTSYESMAVYTANQQALLEQSSPEEAIWSNIVDPTVLVSLDEIED